VSARRVLRVTAIALAVLALAAAGGAWIGATMGLFSGKRPAGLGFDGARFQAPGDWKPNWVASTVARDDAKHYIAPYEIGSDRARAWTALSGAVEKVPGALIVRRDPGYLQVEFHSKVMGFVDDAEFAMDPGGKVIHVRSAARLGIRDFNVNRERLERLRASVAAPG